MVKSAAAHGFAAVRGDGAHRQAVHALIDEHDGEVFEDQAQDGEVVVRIMAGHDDQAGDVHGEQVVDLDGFLFRAAERKADARLVSRLVERLNHVVHHVQAKRRGDVFEHDADQLAGAAGFLRLAFGGHGARYKRPAALHAVDEAVLLEALERLLDRDAADGMGFRERLFGGQAILGQQLSALNLGAELLVDFRI